MPCEEHIPWIAVRSVGILGDAGLRYAVFSEAVNVLKARELHPVHYILIGNIVFV